MVKKNQQMNKLFLIIIALLFVLPRVAFTLEKGKWSFVKDENWCYIGSLPITTDLPENLKRGDNYILVYKLIGSDKNIIQVEAGYNYKLENDILVVIDQSEYVFYTTESSPDTAWTDDDKKVIYAMKKGLELNLTGQSNNSGTIITDTYTLKGFTAAINKLNSDC